MRILASNPRIIFNNLLFRYTVVFQSGVPGVPPAAVVECVFVTLFFFVENIDCNEIVHIYSYREMSYDLLFMRQFLRKNFLWGNVFWACLKNLDSSSKHPFVLLEDFAEYMGNIYWTG